MAKAARNLLHLLRFRTNRSTDYDLVSESGLFDAHYYVSSNPRLTLDGLDPLSHYLQRGWRDGLNPHPLFHTSWYLETYPEVADRGTNPLIDYLRGGAFSGRDPSAHFEGSWYLERYGDVREAGTNPLSHYIKWGLAEGRSAKRFRLNVDAHTQGILGPYESWLAVNGVSDRDVAELRAKLKAREGRLPKVSVVTPVYNSSRELLEEAVKSVRSQVYGDWELCLVDDGSTDAELAVLLSNLERSDDRIQIIQRSVNGGVSAASNSGAEVANGEVLVFLDHDDLMSPLCLAELAIYYADHPEADVVYSDDDKIDVHGNRFAPQFKPDWSPTLLLSWMYMSHVLSVRRTLFEETGGFRADFDGSQDYDFALRATERARYVGHIPKILYHWRAVEGSTAVTGHAKPESFERGRRAVQEAVDRRGLSGAIAIHPDWAARLGVGSFDLRFPDDGPAVTIVIVLSGKSAGLRRCLRFLRSTTYQNYDVLILYAGLKRSRLRKQLHSLVAPKTLRVVNSASDVDGPCQSQLRNEAARLTSSDFLLFLDERCVPADGKWLSQMVGYAGVAGVGAVGALIRTDDGRVSHAGVIHGVDDGLAAAAFAGLERHDPGYLGLVRSSRECSAVSGSVLLTPRSLFADLGGFDTLRFGAAFADVDYCYRLVQAGQTSVYCASAEFNRDDGHWSHHRSPLEIRTFRQVHGQWSDHWYNPNLSLDNTLFEIEAARPETASREPVSLVAVTHNLNPEGAPSTFLDLLVGLKRDGVVNPIVVSPTDGPLRHDYEAAGIKLLIREADGRAATDGVAADARYFRDVGAEVILANTLDSFWAIKSATAAGLPSIWAQHESEGWDSYFDFLPPDQRQAAYGAFSEAYRVVYVAEATRSAWSPLQTRRNFTVIRHGIPEWRLADDTTRWTRESARKALGVPVNAHVLTVIGTLCRRKGQLDLARAYAKLPRNVRSKTHVFLAGRVAEPDYADALAAQAAKHGSHITIAGQVSDPFVYYAASDIFVCTSRVESAPRVILEAMACGLPVVTTPVFGIPEMVQEGVNALFYEPGDVRALARSLRRLLTDENLRLRLASNSRTVLGSQPGFERMVQQYSRVIRQAVNLRMDTFASYSRTVPQTD